MYQRSCSHARIPARPVAQSRAKRHHIELHRVEQRCMMPHALAQAGEGLHCLYHPPRHSEQSKERADLRDRHAEQPCMSTQLSVRMADQSTVTRVERISVHICLDLCIGIAIAHGVVGPM